MSKGRSRWPAPRRPVQFPVNGKVPLLNQGHTLKRMDVVRAWVAPVSPTSPEPLYVVELGMVRSDDQVVKYSVGIDMRSPPPAVVQQIAEGMKHLLTYLNCACVPRKPCEIHAPKADPTVDARPTGIVLTDALGLKKP